MVISFFVTHDWLILLLISACRFCISHPRLMAPGEAYTLRPRYRLFHLASLMRPSCLLYSASSAPLDYLILNYSHRLWRSCLNSSFFKGLRTFPKVIFKCILRVLKIIRNQHSLFVVKFSFPSSIFLHMFLWICLKSQAHTDHYV